jgi:hypothetical protein
MVITTLEINRKITTTKENQVKNSNALGVKIIEIDYTIIMLPKISTGS